MFKESTVIALVAVTDLASSTDFYGRVLGLKQIRSNDSVGAVYASGDGRIGLYKSDTAGRNESTLAAWSVKDLEASVSELRGRGVTFEVYGEPADTGDEAIAMVGPVKSAWFRDPDGNRLCLVQLPVRDDAPDI